MTRTLYLVVCGSPRAARIGELIGGAHAAGWTVVVVATAAARDFIDERALERLTGHPVLFDHRRPDEKRSAPLPDAVLVCPATFNTVNKLAAGIADTYPLGLLTEAVGDGLPVVLAPALNTAQAAHPAFDRSVRELRAAGVTVLYGPGVYEPVPARTGGRPYPWHLALRALETAAPR